MWLQVKKMDCEEKLQSAAVREGVRMEWSGSVLGFKRGEGRQE